MENSPDPDVVLADTWEGRMRQIVSRALSYTEALRVALQCVEVAERYAPREPRSAAETAGPPDAVVDLASALECNVRLAVYSLYHSTKLVEDEVAVERLMRCGRLSDSPE